MWLLLVCRTPPTSDLFDAPDLSFLRVVSLFPNACRNAKGNSSRSKGVAAKAVTASSISTAFMRSHCPVTSNAEPPSDSSDDSLFRSEEHTSELQSLMRISSAVFCLKKKKNIIKPKLDNHKTHE